MNFQSLKLGFLSYLEDKLKSDNKDVALEDLKLSSASIFLYQNEFEEYLKNEVGTDISLFSQDMSEITTLNFEDGQFVYPNNLDEENDILLGLVNDMLSQTDVISASDTDKNGVFSKEEASTFLNGLTQNDGNNSKLSLNDIFSYKKLVQSFNSTLQTQSLASNLTTEEIATPSQVQSSGGSSSSSFSTSYSSSSSSSSSSTSSRSSSSPASTEKNISNMSIKDLESEFETAKSATTEAENAYMEEIEKVDSDLAKKINEVDSKIETKESELENAKTSLDEHKSGLENDKSSLSAATSSISDIDGNISKLKSKLSNPDVDKSSINSQITSLENEKNKIQNETIPALEESIKAHEEEINKLENETIPAVEEELTKLNEELSIYAQELNALMPANPDLKAKMDAFNEAVEYESDVEEVLQKRRADQIKEGESVKLDKKDAPKDYSNLSSFCYDNLPMRYTLDGKEYYCVGFEGYDLDGDGETDFKPNSWEEVQRYFKNGGVRNLGKFGSMQCHNYSEMLGQFVLGEADKEFVQALYDETNVEGYGDKDMAGKMGTDKQWNPRRFAKCAAKDRDEERAIIENELQNGRPCVIRVDGYSHYVAAVGISEDGDILIWDSYEGAMEKLGRSSNDDKNDSGRQLVKTDGVNVYCDGYSYQYSTAKAIDYWSYVGNSPEYVLQNGYL